MMLNEKIVYLRDKHNHTKYNLSVHLGVEIECIDSYESGILIPDEDVLNKLACLYSVTLESLVNDELELEFIERKIDKKLYGHIDTKKDGIILGVMFFVAIIAWFIITISTTLIVPINKYNKTIALFDEGKYARISSEFENFNYLDSYQKKKFADALLKIEEKDFWGAELALDSLDGALIIESNVNTNDIVLEYGKYVYKELGYEFVKWEIVDYEFDLTEYTVNLNINAIYKIEDYLIYYQLDGGTLENKVNSFTYFDTVAIPNPIKDGYSFVGWTSSKSSDPVKDLVIKNGFSDITLYANWEKVEEGNEVS